MLAGRGPDAADPPHTRHRSLRRRTPDHVHNPGAVPGQHRKLNTVLVLVLLAVAAASAAGSDNFLTEPYNALIIPDWADVETVVLLLLCRPLHSVLRPSDRHQERRCGGWCRRNPDELSWDNGDDGPVALRFDMLIMIEFLIVAADLPRMFRRPTAGR